MDELALIVSTIVAIWGIFQTHVTNKLNKEVHRLSVALDQSLTQLYRAHELLREIYMVQCYFLEKGQGRTGDRSKDDLIMVSENIARIAEFRALLIFINDEKLNKLLDTPFDPSPREDLAYLEEVDLEKWRDASWAAWKGQKTEQMHIRLYELIKEKTSEKID